MKRRIVLLGVLGVLAAALFAAPAQAVKSEFGICHATPANGGTVKKYVLIPPDQNGEVNGHLPPDGQHANDVQAGPGGTCPSVEEPPGGGGGEQAGTPAATEQPSGALALTGFDALGVGLIGLAMAGVGLGVRRLTRA